jgi:pilus assembly protein CpaB
MRPSRYLLIIVAIVLAGATTVLVRSWLNAQKQEVAAAPIALSTPSKSVLVARHRLARGTVLTPADMVWLPWPEAGLDAAYVQLGTHAPEYYAGWVARDTIGPGEPFTETKIVAPGSRGFLAAALQPGMRAVSVAVTPTNAAAGFIAPGDQVDLLVTLVMPNLSVNKEGSSFERRAAETVLENIRVIAIDQKLDTKAGETVIAHTATLEVTPKQAEVISLASEIGKLSLVLRSLSSTDDLTASTENPPGGPAKAVVSVASPVATPVNPATVGNPDSVTFDSDVVRLLPKPGRNGGDGSTVILRGTAKSS